MECGARLSSALESDLDDWSETRDSLLTVGLAPGKTHSADADIKQLISIWAIGHIFPVTPHQM